MDYKSPPKLADRFLGWFCKDDLLEEIQGDLIQNYEEAMQKHSTLIANLLYWYEVLNFFRPFAIKRNKNSINTIMIRNYVKFGWRHIIKRKSSSILNILSLSVGIACFLFIFIFLSGEISYDKFHKDSQRIFRVVKDFVDSKGNRLPDATTPPALAPALLHDFAEVESSVRVFPMWGGKFLLGTNENKKFFEDKVIRTDSTFFDLFTFKMIYGDAETALDDPKSVVLTERVAIKYFGKTDVIGQELILFQDENISYFVTGVVENAPENSHFDYDILMRLNFNDIDENWGWYNYYTYIKVIPGTDMENLNKKIQPLYEGYMGDQPFYNQYYTQPLEDIHLKSQLKWELSSNGDERNVVIFAALAIFVIVISCINYVNLTIADSLKRIREIGIRKVYGAARRSLVSQFLVETIMITLISLVIGVIGAELLLSYSYDILGRHVSLFEQNNVKLFAVVIPVVLLIGLLAGMYPAFYLSSFRSIDSANNRIGDRNNNLRKSLLVLQFSISVFMIFGSLMVYKQLNYLKQVDKGFDMDQVLILDNFRTIDNQESFKNELSQMSGIRNAGISSGVIGGLNWTFTVGYPESFVMNYVSIDTKFAELMGFEFIAGRNFNMDISTDSTGLNLIVNETGLKELGLTLDDVGKEIPMVEDSDNDSIYYGSIVGVVKDFHFSDFKNDIKPFSFFYRNRPMDYLSVKVDPMQLDTSLSQIENLWSDMTNGAEFNYYFLDQEFSTLYEKEQKFSTVLFYLTILALFIAFMGMYGIANLTIQDKIKDIAIHKILGASTRRVINLISMRFIVLVLLANLIAIPISILIITNWLEGFAYHTQIGPMVYLISIGATLLITLLLVGGQTFKVSLNNPVNSLRYK